MLKRRPFVIGLHLFKIFALYALLASEKHIVDGKLFSYCFIPFVGGFLVYFGNEDFDSEEVCGNFYGVFNYLTNDLCGVNDIFGNLKRLLVVGLYLLIGCA